MTSDSSTKKRSPLITDTISGIVVFLVALPLCLGIALASGADPISGLISGIIGGIVVGSISGSRTSVSGPAAGLTAIVAAQIATLGSFENFLFAVMVAGALQIVLGILRAGALVAFVPTSVINGLLAAIGVILILKQIPHLLGHDTDPEGEMSFSQPDHENTFSELFTIFQGEIHTGAIVIGLISVAILVLWQRIDVLKKSLVPAPLIVVLLAVAINELFKQIGEPWAIQASHLVEVPISENLSGFFGLFSRPDFSMWNSPSLYLAAITIAIVATLETLLNIEAVDKIDRQRRLTPKNRELVAQGFGNLTAGALGGLPMTSVIVRSSVNVNAGTQTKLATILHGFFLLGSVALLPQYLSMIPLSSLAAILIVTGFKLARPELFRQMAQGGRYELIPFLCTLLAIVFTDLLIGILIGLAVSVTFILNSSLRSPVRSKLEKHMSGELLRIELGNQVSFLNKASLEDVLFKVQKGTHVLLDGSKSDYIDPDILTLLRDFRDGVANAHGVEVSFYGFKRKYNLEDSLCFVDYSTRELRQLMTPADVLEILKEGNRRFASDDRLTRDWRRQLNITAKGQHPYAVVLSCIDSRAPVETIMDLGLGDIFSVRVAGNVTSDKVLGSMEYACAMAGAKLILVLGHSRCGAVTSTVELSMKSEEIDPKSGFENLPTIVSDINASIDPGQMKEVVQGHIAKDEFIEQVAKRNVMHSVEQILSCSTVLRQHVAEGKVAIVGGMYDISTGLVDFFVDEAQGLNLEEKKNA